MRQQVALEHAKISSRAPFILHERQGHRDRGPRDSETQRHSQSHDLARLPLFVPYLVEVDFILSILGPTTQSF